MQPVYVMGGSIYTFGGNGGFGSPMSAKETKELELLATSSGKRSARSRAARASKMGINMGAFGTVKPEFDYVDPDTGQVIKAGDD